MDIKSWLKTNDVLMDLWSRYRAKAFERRVGAERLYYEREARQKGLVYSEEEIPRLLEQRLSQRGLARRLQPPLHVFAAIHHSNWEDYNLIPALSKLGTLTRYDWVREGFNHNAPDWLPNQRARMNRALLSAVQAAHARQPIDLFFGYVGHWQVSRDTIEAINKLGIVTVNFALDDAQAFRGARRNGILPGRAPLASAFDLNWTNTRFYCEAYMVEGGIPLFLPEGANPEVHHPYPVPRDLDVVFVGQRYGPRPGLIRRLRQRGIPIQAHGQGWPSGELTIEQMVRLYSRSRITLGIGGVGHSLNVVCLKGRDFEVPMSGGLYLTSYNPELELSYDIGNEILCYRDMDDLVEQVRMGLSNPDRLEQIRAAGRARARREHTWQHRVAQLLSVLGLPNDRID